MMIPLLFFSLLLLFPPPSLQQQEAFPSPSSTVAFSGNDVHCLLEFKKGILSDPSGQVLSTWTQLEFASPGCPAAWYGISCDPTGSFVVFVSLDSLGLSGSVKFSTLAGMTSLVNLTLSNNNLTGRLDLPVPMPSLRNLDLSNNQFAGPIPQTLTQFFDLNYVNLSFNNLSGGFPGTIGNLQQLRVLDVRSNRLEGDVSELLSALKNVEYVDLSGNSFYGQLYSEQQPSFANTIKYMNLSNNSLDGPFFSEGSMQLFRNLVALDVSHNRISGNLPNFTSLYNLKSFRAQDNLLSGPLPETLFRSPIQLEELDLSVNGFTGSIFNINSSSFRILNLSSNALLGPLPSNIGSCLTLDLSENMISGDLSAMQDWGAVLEVLELSSNNLSGNFPNQIYQEGLRSIKISNNSLEGLLPSVLESYRNLSILDLSLNKLTGSLLPSLFTSTNLAVLNLSRNQFTGTIPFQSHFSSESLIVSSSMQMVSLDLSENSLSGPLLPDIIKMENLKLLDLHKNDLSGELPSEIGKLDLLEYLDLSSNHFKGWIPDIPQSSLKWLNVSYNDLQGPIPENLRGFPDTSFHPGNTLLGTFLDGSPAARQQHHLKSRIRVAVIVGSIGAVVLIFFILMAVYRIRSQEICGRNNFKCQSSGRDLKFERVGHDKTLESHKNVSVKSSMSFSNDHLLTSAPRSRSMSARKDSVSDTVEFELPHSRDIAEASSELVDLGEVDERIMSSPGSAINASPQFNAPIVSEKPVVLDVCSPDRLVGEVFLLGKSLVFTAEDLSQALAEVLGRSSHGTTYKATLGNGQIVTVKWLRDGIVKRRKEFAKEIKRVGVIKHPNVVSLRAYYCGLGEQERLIVSDYVNGDNLALHLHETGPRRHSNLTLHQRLKIAISIARCLCFLHHDRGLPHGNLKPTNILISDHDFTALLKDYGLHHLMTPSGIAEHMLNLGALGYRAPELATETKPFPSFKADVYAFGVILMELLTGKSAGDIISGQKGAVDLTDWVQICAREGRGRECFAKDIGGSLKDASRVMNELLAISLRCILPVNERPNIRTVLEDLCSIIV